jgi:hypothetical protein
MKNIGLEFKRDQLRRTKLFYGGIEIKITESELKNIYEILVLDDLIDAIEKLITNQLNVVPNREDLKKEIEEELDTFLHYPFSFFSHNNWIAKRNADSIK